MSVSCQHTRTIQFKRKFSLSAKNCGNNTYTDWRWKKNSCSRAGDDHLCFAFVSLSDGKPCFGIRVHHFAAVLMLRDILNKNIIVQEMSQLRLSLKYYLDFWGTVAPKFHSFFLWTHRLSIKANFIRYVPFFVIHRQKKRKEKEFHESWKW